MALFVGGIAAFLQQRAQAAGGRVVGWGSNDYGENDIPPYATNILAIGTGPGDSVALSENGTLLGWGGGGTVPPTGISNLVDIASGGDSSMGVRPDGSLWVWSPQQEIDSVPDTATNVIKMSPGNIHVMVLRGDGGVVAWGNDAWGQTDVPANVTNVVDIAAGGVHGMALRQDGVLRMWGWFTRIPPAATNVVAVGATYDHSLALRSDGTVVEWDAYNDYPTPAGLSNVVAISNGGAQHWLALRSDGTVVGWCWTSSAGSNVPPGLHNVTAIAAGSDHSLALVNDPGLRIQRQPRAATALAGDSVVFKCEGRGAMPLSYIWSQDGRPIQGSRQPFIILTNVQVNSAGMYQAQITNSVGSIATEPVPLTVVATTPRMLPSLTSLVLLPGAWASLNTDTRGTEPMGFQWQHNGTEVAGATGVNLELNNVRWSDTGAYRLIGTNSLGMAASDPVNVSVVQAASWGNVNPTQTNVPASATNLVAIACGDAHTLALTADGRLLAWGDNSSGQCDPPAQDLVSIAAGVGFSLVARSNGQCIAWGNNYDNRTNVPPAATNVIAVSAGAYHCLALRQDGTVVGWGFDYDGQVDVPPTATNVVALASGADHSLALREDGSVVAWGLNLSGQANVPASATSIVAIAGGSAHSLALKGDGRVLAWGDNSVGQCDVPASLSNAVAVAANGNFSMGLRRDGVVIGWGDNSYNRTAVPALVTNVDAIAAGDGVTAALVDDGAFHWHNPPLAPALAAGNTMVLLPRFFGRCPDTCQWLLNGSPIAGATNAWMVFYDAQQVAAGEYSLVVTAGSTSLTGIVASVTVVPSAPVVVQPPASQVVALGGSASFNVSAKGTEPITYQWRLNGINLAGATSTALTVTNVQWRNTGTYDVVLSSSVGSIVSVGATLTFQPTVDAFDLAANNAVYAFAPQPDGKVLFGGYFTSVSGQMRTNLARLNADGTLDSAFNPSVGGSSSVVMALALQPDGKILVGGQFTSMCGQVSSNLARLYPDGNLDLSFNPMPAGNVVNCLALQPDGKILLGGAFTTVLGQARTNLARLLPDGTLDAAFNPGAVGSVWSLAVQADGKILAGGSFTALAGQPRTNIGRLYADGTLDTDFNATAPGSVYALAMQPDRRILVGGAFSTLAGQSRNNIARLETDGTVDSSFNPGANRAVYALALQDDGKILAAGDFTSLGGQSCNYIGRINGQGTLDPAFNPSANSTVYGMALQPDGRVLAGGYFTTFNGQARTRIARVANSDPATHALLSIGANITWLRGAASPEVSRAAFEVSTNGTDWLSLGVGAYTSGAWQLNGVTVPANATVRARGYATGGYRNGSAWLIEDGSGPPAVSTQPISQTNSFGTNAMLCVLAAGTPPFSYQWRKDGVDLVEGGTVFGSHTATLTLLGVSGADAGRYSVLISNNFGSVISAAATLRVVDPLITVQPVSQVTNAGQSVVFRVTAIGAAPFAYQWRRGGVALSGATASSLILTNVQWADAGDYDVLVGNLYETNASSAATLSLPAVLDALNASANGPVYALAVQTDGKILVGGNFAGLGGHARYNIGRLLPGGALDTTFNPVAGDSVFTLAVQADSRILLGGIFPSLGGQPCSCLGRINADGTLDAAFNPAPSTNVNAIVIQPDGKILVGGAFTNLCGQVARSIGRLNADGTLDTTFSASVGGTVYSLALQPDGAVVVGGAFTNLCGQPRNRIGQLNGDGSLDTSFSATANTTVYCLLVQPDGRILAGGAFTSLCGQTRMYLGRLNTDGTLDTAFNPGANSTVYSLALQADGKILAGGNFTMLSGQTRRYIARLNPDGTLDSTLNPGASSVVYALGLQADGSILAGGNFFTFASQSRTRLARLSNTYPATQGLAFDGSNITWLRNAATPEVWRTTFEVLADGFNWSPLGVGQRIDHGWQLAAGSIELGQSIRARGYTTGGYQSGSSYFVEDYLGAPCFLSQPFSQSNNAGDTATLSCLGAGPPPLSYQWLKNGVGLADGGNVSGTATSLLTLSNVFHADQADYSVVVSNLSGSRTSLVARLTVLDPLISVPPVPQTASLGQSASFSVTAKGTAPLSYQWWHGSAALGGGTNSTLVLSNLQPADVGGYQVVVSGPYSSVTSAVVVLTLNLATVDTAFDPGASMEVHSLVVQADGKIVVGGRFTMLGGQTRNYLGRLNADGTLDTAFNPEANDQVFPLALQPDGKILVGGDFTTLGGQTRNYLGRLNADGTLDTAFNPEVDESVFSLAVQADGKILVGGWFTTLGGQTRNNLGRLNADGTLDTAFNPGVSNIVRSLALQPDGKILAGGDFTTLGGQTRNHLGRLNADGTLDTAFNPGASISPASLVPQADGKILVGGYFTNLDGQTRNYLGRLNADGTLDTAFNPGASSYVLSLSLQADGKILVGGVFTTLGDQTRNALGRLNGDGTVDPSFNPAVSDYVDSLGVQADGNILVGGVFTMLAGQTRNNLGRLNNTGPATSVLSYDGSTITWMRGGTSPEVWRTSFESSTNNGADWVSLGAGARIMGGWRLNDVSVPANATLCARGFVTCGNFGSSSWFVETQLQLLPSISAPQVCSNHFGFSVSGLAGQPLVIEASTNLQNWIALLTNTLDTNSLYFGDAEWTNFTQRFYRARVP